MVVSRCFECTMHIGTGQSKSSRFVFDKPLIYSTHHGATGAGSAPFGFRKAFPWNNLIISTRIRQDSDGPQPYAEREGCPLTHYIGSPRQGT